MHDRGRIRPLVSECSGGTTKIGPVGRRVDGIGIVLLLLSFLISLADWMDLKRRNILNVVTLVAFSGLLGTIVCCRERERLSWLE